jgi:O-antigen/teichoic acid export membrane protein
MSGFYKGISGLSLFVSIPLLIGYLGETNYGLWVLVFTLFQWIFSMDFGLASVLKTKIPVLLHEKKTDLLISYIKSTYGITSIIAFFLFSIFYFISKLINLKQLLLIPEHSEDFVSNLFVLNIFFFCLNFIFNVHKSLFVAFLRGKYAEQSIAVNQLMFLFFTFLLLLFFPNLSVADKLIFVSLVNGIGGMLVNIIYTIYFFTSEKISFKSNEKTPKSFLKEILSLGVKYMFIQIGLLVIFTSDNYILSSAFGPKDVVPYEIVNKLFQFPSMLLFAALSPLWSIFATAYVAEDRSKLLNVFNKFNRFFFLIFISIAFLYLSSPIIISYWIKNPLDIPSGLLFITAIATLLRIFTSFYSFFLYGVGKLNNYILLLLFSILVKLPLSYWLISLGYGINSVIITTVMILLIWTIIIPLECYYLVHKLKKNE